MAANYARHDEALALLEGLGPDLTNWMTSHVPMVAEALAAMGEAAAAVTWVGAHRKTVRPRGAATAPIAVDDWRAALGQRWTFADWSVLFAEEIARDGWQAVCDRWVARLAPGFAAAAAHGAIRVGHAARALRAGETPLRLQEFADALALWASTYVELPAARGTSPKLSPFEALARVPLVPEAKRQNGGAITVALGQLVHAPGFDGVLDLIDVESPEDTALEAAEAFARVVAAEVHSPLTAIVFTHGVTGMGAALNLLPHVSEATAEALLRYGWQSGAALVSAYATAPFDGARPLPPPVAVNRVARAVAHGDDHVIKLTEACLALNARRPSSAFLAAADTVAANLPEDRT